MCCLSSGTDMEVNTHDSGRWAPGYQEPGARSQEPGMNVEALVLFFRTCFEPSNREQHRGKQHLLEINKNKNNLELN